ncbi:MAG: HD domain-containing phosphohydrolase [Candidatus Firestonebacteria bacterium]
MSSADPESKELKETVSMLQNFISIMDLKLNIFQFIGKISTSSFDLDKMLDSIMDMIMATMKVDAGSLLLLNEDTDLLEFKVAKGEKGEDVKKYKFALGEGVVGWVTQTGKSQVVPDVLKDDHFKRDVAEEIKFPIENILCVPLKIQEKVIGVIEIMNKFNKKRFIKEDLDLLESLAGQISLIIQNAKLFHDSQRKIEVLSTLIKVSAIINSTLNLNKLLNEVMESATQLLFAETSSIFLIDQEKQELYFEVVTGKTKERVSQIRIPISEGVAGWVARTGKSILVPDVTKDTRFYNKVDEKSSFKTKSIIAVPLKVKEKIIGVIEVLNKKDGSLFYPYELELLESLSDQSAVAIDNAMVHKELQELFLNTITSLARAIESKDAYTGGHIDRIENFSLAIANELDLTIDDKERIRWAALFHDLGKIGIDEAILRKPGKLTNEEYEEIKKHPQLGADILKPIKQFSHIIPGILHHQERWDGKGYPNGFKGEAISIDGRIIAVADTFDAMTSDRPYRKGLPKEMAIGEIKKCAGTQFDPKVVESFLKCCEKRTVVTENEMKEKQDK